MNTSLKTTRCHGTLPLRKFATLSKTTRMGETRGGSHMSVSANLAQFGGQSLRVW